MGELYSKSELMEAVKLFLTKRGFDLAQEYDNIFDPARVPIFAYKDVDGKNVNIDEGGREEIFVDIITERRINTEDYFRDREFGKSMDRLRIENASSAQFFRHYFPNAKIYWAVPKYAINNGNFKTFIGECNAQKIGILEIHKNKKNKFVVKERKPIPISLIDEKTSTLVNELGNNGVKLTSSQIRLVKSLLANNNHDNLSYLVFYPEPLYKASDISVRDYTRNISRELINRMSELENISYKDTLINFSKNYFTMSEDDYIIAHKVTNDLWKKYDLEFPILHKDFEQILKLDPRYRDHFLHAFQVFLFGAYVIDKMYKELNISRYGNTNGDRIEDAWIIASTYHDFNYTIQMFDEWTKEFFKKALFINNNPASLQLAGPYVKEGYMFNTKRLARALEIELDKLSLEFFYNRILDIKNHAILSGLSLLKYLENSGKLSERVIDSAARAITLHDYAIWGVLSGQGSDIENDAINQFKSKKILRNLPFGKDPISCLLIISDNIQEEGRVGSKYTNNRAQLDLINYKDGKIVAELSFNSKDLADVTKAYESKRKELQEVRKFLGGERIYFNITIKNGGTGEKSTIEM